jgi:GNAT superfamily N-acetyltransferase
VGEVTTWFLEMRDREAVRAPRQVPGLIVEECRIRQYPVNRFLYQFVGSAWQWRDKLGWSDQQWRAYAERPALRTWMALSEGSPAGYYELEQQGDGDVEIKYFGLAPAFIGRGFGGFLLGHALRSAWEWEGTCRVWVHTCSLDHPSALANYQARGMSIYASEVEPA